MSTKEKAPVKPIYFDEAANSLLFGLPKAWNAYLLAAKGQEHSVWCLGKTQLILFTTDQEFSPQKLSSSHLFWIELGCL